MIDLLGFAGSGLIVLSLTMKSIVRLRIVGLCGAVVFVSYGLALTAWPVVVTNCVTLSIHVFHLRRLLLSDREVGEASEAGANHQEGQDRSAGGDGRTIRSHRIGTIGGRESV